MTDTLPAISDIDTLPGSVPAPRVGRLLLDERERVGPSAVACVDAKEA
ncbi:MAG: hypothetical protein ACLP8S_26880 [Solirubrobacteraceae bacterium]